LAIPKILRKLLQAVDKTGGDAALVLSKEPHAHMSFRATTLIHDGKSVS
jgi:hypothetical protein